MCLGFKNQWGALLEQQAEIQRLADEQEKHKKMAKNYKYKSQLEAQLQEKNKKHQLEQKIRYNPNDQKVLSEDYKKFEQKEFDRMNMGRLKSKQVMQDNQHYISQKHREHYTMEQQDKDMFNRQALEDKLHAEKTAEEKRRWKDWQRESLKNDYEEQIKRKEQLKNMEQEKEKVYANQFRSTVENYESTHNQILENRRRKNEQVLDHQQRTIIPDENERRKQDAMNNMRKQFESTEKETLMKELNRLNKRHNEAKETKDVLKMQMSMRQRRHQTAAKEEESYKKYIDSTVGLLTERDRKVAEERKRMRESYAKELENQIKEHNDLEKKNFNEMDERSMTLNQRGLIAYEAGQRNAGLFKLPGIDRDPQDDREYFGRYARKKEPSKLGAELALSHTGGYNDTMSNRHSHATLSQGPIKTLPYSPAKYNQGAPKTSEDYTARSRRGIHSPTNAQTNILGQPANQRSLNKYNSVSALHHKNSEENVQRQDSKDIGILKAKKANILSARDHQEPEYEPTKRDEGARRSYQPPKREEQPKPESVPQKELPKKQVTMSPEVNKSPVRTARNAKIKQAPASLLNIDNLLNQRVLGSMRAGNLNISKDNQAYGTSGQNTFRGYSSSLN